MAVITTFLVNLLCSVVSCDSKLPGPEIRTGPGATPDFEGVLRSASSSIVRTATLHSELPLSGNANLKIGSDQDPVVFTKYGGLRGYVMRSIGNRKFYAFEGVPYASPPIGDLRFRAPEPPSSWTGIRNARNPGPECLQLSLPKALRVVGNEDCLYLQIYTPSIFEGLEYTIPVPKFPVIIAIHGGQYYYGSGNELGPAYVLEKDVVLVTFNFRLGVLGFLGTGDEHMPGNFGLKDQFQAIKWVHENIERFGGDPSRITLLGQNSGASSAHLHLLSPKSSPYIASGVSLSGTAFSSWAINSPKEARRLTSQLCQIVFCPVTNSTEVIANHLRKKNPVELVAAQYRLLEFAPFPSTLFAPILEEPGPHAILTQKPSVSYDLNLVPGKPWIFGGTSQEGYLGLLHLKMFLKEGTLRTNWNELAPIFLNYKHTSENVNGTTSRLTKFYFGRKSPKSVEESKLAAIYGDMNFLHGMNKALHFHSRLGPTYAYMFGFKGKYSLGQIAGRRPAEWGVGSGEDWYYYFNSSSYMPGFKKVDEEELAMSNLLTTVLTNFATLGEPLLPKDESMSIYTRLWDPVVPSAGQALKFLQLNKEIKMIPQPFKKRLAFWTRLEKADPLMVDPLAKL